MNAPEPLYVIGSDGSQGDHDRSRFVGTLAKCRVRYPKFDPDADPPPGVWFANLEDSLGYLINPESADARRLYLECTGDVAATSGDVCQWLLEEASRMPFLRGALALIARRQRAITAAHLRQLLQEQMQDAA